MVDLTELATRVEAAQREYREKSEQQGKLVLRLNDLAVIVEGSLARQRQALETAETKLKKLATDNEQLRSMVLALLNLVEGRNLDSLPQIMHRMERSVKDLMGGQNMSVNVTPTSSPALPHNEVPTALQPSAMNAAAASVEAIAPTMHGAPHPETMMQSNAGAEINDAALENLRAMAAIDQEHMLMEPGDEEGRTPPQKLDTSPAAPSMQSLTSLVSRLGMSVNSVVPLRRQG